MKSLLCWVGISVILLLCHSVPVSSSCYQQQRVEQCIRGGKGAIIVLGTEIPRTTPGLVPLFPGIFHGGKRVVKIATSNSGFYSAAITDAGEFYVWGCENKETRLNRIVPHPLGLLPMDKAKSKSVQIRKVALGDNYFLMVSEEGILYHYTPSVYAQSDLPAHPIDSSIFNGKKVVKVSCGMMHSGVINESGDVYTWGRGESGCLGHGNTESKRVPTFVEAFRGVKCIKISCGALHTAVLTENGKLYTFGDGKEGKLGLTSEASKAVPCQVRAFDFKPVTKISCGMQHSAALVGPNLLYTWGPGSYGRLGNGGYATLSVPTVVNALNGINVLKVSCGGSHSLAIVGSEELIKAKMIVPNDLQTKQGSDSSNNNNNANNNNANQNPPEKLNGEAEKTYPNGEKYSGGFVNGKKHGKGVWTSADGDRFEGSFKDDLPHGDGVLSYWNRSGSFAGGFRNGKKHGCGVFTWLDGTKTIREYQNDVLVAEKQMTSQDDLHVELNKKLIESEDKLQAVNEKLASSEKQLEEQLSQIQQDHQTTIQQVKEQHQKEIETINKERKQKEEELNEQVDNEERKNLCIICMDNPRDVVVMPCMHFLYCMTCITGVKDNKCPSCRTPTHGKLQCSLQP